VTFTATVSGSAPTGTVNFKDGANSISGCSAVALTGSGGSRTAQCATAALAVGAQSITAGYSGDANNAASTSAPLSQVVNKAASTTTLSSSANPAALAASVTFTATVTGSAPTGTVNFKDGANSVTGCSAVALTGSGGSRTAQCATSALAVGGHSITAAYGGDASNVASASSVLSQMVSGSGGGGGGTSINAALAANGGLASASSTYTSTYPVSAVNDGDRTGRNFGTGGVWKDATLQSFPDWVQIDFNGAKTIDHVTVYSVQDDNINPVDPSATMTFTQRGITAFEVQSWNGAAWVSLGTVSGNNLVKRNVAFAATTTSRIRVLINGISNGRYSLVAEIEAWTH
jgi:hypothetical protein